ncbi:MAG: hypothetical protein V1749_06040 [Candidatus Desantisbacteria bacterium]
MIDIPRDVLLQYNAILTKKSIPISSQYLLLQDVGHYKMWVRYYLDFCNKAASTNKGSKFKQNMLKW